MNKNSINIAVIGSGYWGKNLVRVLYNLGVLSAVCDKDPESLTQVIKDYPGVSAVSSYSDIIKDKTIKAVVISAPAKIHYQLAKEALLAGKDVFIEKPLALTVKEGRQIVRISDKNKRILMVGHILQYHPAVIKLKELISSGELGKVQYVYSNRLNIGKIRIEENILWSFAPHDISCILMLLNEEPNKVSSFGGDYLNRGIYDTSMTILEFKGGVKAHIFVSWLHPYKEQRLVIVGSKGMAVFDDVSENKLCIYSHQIDWVNGKIPVAHKAKSRVVDVEKSEPLVEEMSHFIDCIVCRKKPRTDGQEALRVLKILTQAGKSLRGGKL